MCRRLLRRVQRTLNALPAWSSLTRLGLVMADLTGVAAVERVGRSSRPSRGTQCREQADPACKRPRCLRGGEHAARDRCSTWCQFNDDARGRGIHRPTLCTCGPALHQVTHLVFCRQRLGEALAGHLELLVDVAQVVVDRLAAAEDGLRARARSSSPYRKQIAIVIGDPPPAELVRLRSAGEGEGPAGPSP
jgi:hypothetical protein